MKNEAAFGYEALLRNMKNEKRALRFMALAPLHRSRRASASYSRSECFVDTPFGVSLPLSLVPLGKAFCVGARGDAHAALEGTAEIGL